MARENLDQPKLIEDERVANVPAQFVLTDDVLRLWSSLPDDQRHWQDMVDVVNALNEITGSHSELKKRTIIALVQAKLRNKPARSVFDEKEYCNESTWHKRWKHDPLIMRVYEFVLSAATTFSGAAEAVNIPPLQLTGYAPRKCRDVGIICHVGRDIDIDSASGCRYLGRTHGRNDLAAPWQVDQLGSGFANPCQPASVIPCASGAIYGVRILFVTLPA